MRRKLAEVGVPQPRFAALRSIAERRLAADEVGFPAVLKPADSGGQRGIFRVESLDDVEAHLHEALDRVADRRGDPRGVRRRHRDERDRDRARRRGDPADAVRPAAAAGRRLRRRLDPPLPGHDLRRPARGVGARRGADGARARAADRDRVPAADRDARRPRRSWSSARRGSRAGRWPTSCGTRSASTSSTCRSAWRSARSCRTSSCCRTSSSRSRSASSPPSPGRCRPGSVKRVGPLDRVLAMPGVVQAETYLVVGETIRPVRARRRPPRLRDRGRGHEPRGARAGRGGGARGGRRGRGRGAGLRIESLDHLVLTVRDLDATVAFYERLGMRHVEFAPTGTRSRSARRSSTCTSPATSSSRRPPSRRPARPTSASSSTSSTRPGST